MLGLTAFGARSEGRIRVLETRALGGRQQLHVIEVEGRRLLVGTSEAGIQRLARLPDVHDMPDCGADRAAPEAARRGAQVGRGPRLVSVLGTLLRLAPVLVVLAGLREQPRRVLTKAGWTVLRIWECALTLKRARGTLSRLQRALKKPAR